MIAAIKYAWCRFVAFLMLKTFGSTPEEILELKRTRLDNARLRVAFSEAKQMIERMRDQRDAAHELAENCAKAATEARRGGNAEHKLVKALEEIKGSRTHAGALRVASRALLGARHDAPTQPAMKAAPAVELGNDA